MKITSVDCIQLSIPFSDGSPGQGIMPGTWSELDFLLVRIETDSGLTGWGEGFGYFCREAVSAVIERSIAPLLVGKEITSPPEILEQIQRSMVLQGRHGIATFAQSGIDIALWDLKAKEHSVPLYKLLGEKCRESIPAYASLVRYTKSDLVKKYTEKVMSENYPEIKLHEITMPAIYACHESTGGSVPVSVDVNCNWSENFTREVIPELLELNTSWLEEPIFPPEDFHTLADLRKTGIPIATGENACTASPFQEMIRIGAADLLQPSITKVGGVTEFQKICKLLDNESEYRLMPHSPYFGPGYLATLQMAAIEPKFELFEYLYIEPENWIYKNMPLPENGQIPLPEGIGLGFEPDMPVLEKYTVS